MSFNQIYSKTPLEKKDSKEFSNTQPIKIFLALYTLTYGFYIFFWFYKILKDFKEYKSLTNNVHLLLWKYVAFYSIALIVVFPLIFYYVISETGEFPPITLQIINSFRFGVESIFVFLLLQKIIIFLREGLNELFSAKKISLLFFLIGELTIFIPEANPFYMQYFLIIVFLAGINLSVVQKDLNRFWGKEQYHLAVRISPSRGEIISICVFSIWWLIGVYFTFVYE